MRSKLAFTAVLLASVFAACCAASGAQATVWLCRPGLKANPCLADRTATAVTVSGTKTVERFGAVKRPKIDCFYVYPTVSAQRTANATLDIDPAQIGVAKAQASRFAARCRVFAPIYRQLTVPAILGQVPVTPAARVLAYGDVRAAWLDYLRHENHGRGVVLIGHSQGSFMVRQLITKEIDPRPAVRRRLVSALLIGGNVTVKAGRDVGGDFQHIPACRKAAQVGCVVAYSTFDVPPPANSLFGRTASPGLQVLCTNPAALAGGTAPLRAFFAADATLGTPWVTYPGLLSGHCVTSGGATWLQIDHSTAAGETRPVPTAVLGPTWGLHLGDMNLTLGDMVSLVGRQAAAYARRG